MCDIETHYRHSLCTVCTAVSTDTITNMDAYLVMLWICISLKATKPLVTCTVTRVCMCVCVCLYGVIIIRWTFVAWSLIGCLCVRCRGYVPVFLFSVYIVWCTYPVISSSLWYVKMVCESALNNCPIRRTIHKQEDDWTSIVYAAHCVWLELASCWVVIVWLVVSCCCSL